MNSEVRANHKDEPTLEEIREFILERKDAYPIIFKFHLSEHNDPDCFHCIAIKEAYKDE